MSDYQLSCDCGAVRIEMTGEPRVRGTCHCGDCRTLLQVPFHAVNAWLPDQLTITKGAEDLITYQHPHLTMQRVYCKHCGETVYNTNAMGWKIVSQFLVAKHYDPMPPELTSQSHFFYDRRIIDVADDLPKR